jgi:hypothetical protein
MGSTWGHMGACPPITHTHTQLPPPSHTQLPRTFLSSSKICIASSRVGVSTSPPSPSRRVHFMRYSFSITCRASAIQFSISNCLDKLGLNKLPSHTAGTIIPQAACNIRLQGRRHQLISLHAGSEGSCMQCTCMHDGPECKLWTCMCCRAHDMPRTLNGRGPHAMPRAHAMSRQ